MNSVKFVSIVNKDEASAHPFTEKFTIHKTIEFHQIYNFSYRTEVTQSKEGRLYVTLVRHWLNPLTQKWLPTHKQLYLPLAAWKNLKQAVTLIDESLDTLLPHTGGERPVASAVGMNMNFQI
jgi:hypothetical protein